MKYLISASFAFSLFFTACNSDKTNNRDDEHGNQTNMEHTDSGNVPEASKSNSSISVFVAPYLQMKNALVKDDDQGAATAGTAMYEAFGSFDAKELNADQAKAYKDIQDDAKEHAEHIGKNAGNIAHQREHFDLLSKDMYQLVKTIGAGQKLYYDFCPMYNDHKGASWLSESQAISNPYYGKEMATCGNMIEELK